MRRAIALLVSAGLLVAPGEAQAALEFRGVALGLWGTDAQVSYVPQLQEIRAMGANAVLLPVLTYVDTVTGTAVYARDGHTAPDAVIRRAIADAHALGLQVALLPVVRIEHRVDREWRGRLAPVDRDAFFASYRRMIVGYATLAEAAGAELFFIGSELASLEDAPDWRSLIADVRQAYRGTVSYSANWDHYASVPFWDALDALALTGYYELSETTQPTQAQLTAAWGAVRAQLLAWRRGYPGKPLLFTEVGYPAQDGASVTPWDYTLQNPVDLEEQRMCYAAFTATWRNDPALAGVFFWDWSGAGGPEDGHYTPRGKPAAAELRAYFEADAAAPDPPLGTDGPAAAESSARLAAD